MAYAFIVMYFTWDHDESGHMFMKYLQNRCCTIDKSKVKAVYKVTLERSGVLYLGALKLKRSVTLPASPWFLLSLSASTILDVTEQD